LPCLSENLEPMPGLVAADDVTSYPAILLLGLIFIVVHSLIVRRRILRVLGLTGGIASGKSTVSGILADLGAIIIDADQISRELTVPGSPLLAKIVEHFGSEILFPDGKLNRRLLAGIIFRHPEKRKVLEQITHPAIISRIKGRLEEIKKERPHTVVVIEAALLIEAGMTQMVDEVWLVTVDRSVQIQRLMSRDNLSFKEAIARIESQLPVEKKLAHAHVVIDTGKDLQSVRQQVLDHWQRFIL
jgi:dephospho-CoA kinase